jgi:hypothetical protein
MARVSFSVEAAGALSFFFEAHGRLSTVPLLFGRVVIVSTAKDLDCPKWFPSIVGGRREQSSSPTRVALTSS